MLFYVYFCMWIVKHANCSNIFECEKTIEYVCNQKGNDIFYIDNIKMKSFLQQYKNYACLAKCFIGDKCECANYYIYQTQQLINEILERKNRLKHEQNINISRKYLNKVFCVLKMKTIREKQKFQEFSDQITRLMIDLHDEQVILTISKKYLVALKNNAFNSPVNFDQKKLEVENKII